MSKKEAAVIEVLETPPSIGVKSFSQSVMGQELHFKLTLMDQCAHAWVGLDADLTNFAVAIPTRFEPIPSTAELLGSALDSSSTGMAQRLAKKSGMQFFVSCNIPMSQDSQKMLAIVEKRILKEISAAPAVAAPAV